MSSILCSICWIPLILEIPTPSVRVGDCSHGLKLGIMPWPLAWQRYSKVVHSTLNHWVSPLLPPICTPQRPQHPLSAPSPTLPPQRQWDKDNSLLLAGMCLTISPSKARKRTEHARRNPDGRHNETQNYSGFPVASKATKASNHFWYGGAFLQNGFHEHQQAGGWARSMSWAACKQQLHLFVFSRGCNLSHRWACSKMFPMGIFDTSPLWCSGLHQVCIVQGLGFSPSNFQGFSFAEDQPMYAICGCIWMQASCCALHS